MRLAGDSWNRMFDSFQRTAFRLETLPAYGVESEDEELAEFRATGRVTIPDDDPWLVRVRDLRRTGRWVGRVHVVCRPLSDYLRYEFLIYAHTIRAGEDVRILDLTDAPDTGLPDQDFWLFDDARVVRMDYAVDGRQLGRELLNGVDPAPYIAWKDLALRLAVPFDEYLVKQVE